MPQISRISLPILLVAIFVSCQPSEQNQDTNEITDLYSYLNILEEEFKNLESMEEQNMDDSLAVRAAQEELIYGSITNKGLQQSSASSIIEEISMLIKPQCDKKDLSDPENFLKVAIEFQGEDIYLRSLRINNISHTGRNSNCLNIGKNKITCSSYWQMFPISTDTIMSIEIDGRVQTEKAKIRNKVKYKIKILNYQDSVIAQYPEKMDVYKEEDLKYNKKIAKVYNEFLIYRQGSRKPDVIGADEQILGDE